MSIQKSKTHQIIALTGGIASGKSYATELFASRGFEVIDLDIISAKIWQLLQTKKDFLNLFKTSDKTKIKQIIFNNKKELLTLENYLHPKILKVMQDKIKLTKTHTIVAVPLLFEKELYAYFDSAIVIAVQPSLQIQRMLARDKITETLATKILQSQATNEQRLEIAKYLPTVFIENNYGIANFTKSLENYCAKYEN